MEYFLSRDNTEIYYKIRGEGSPIVFIHGFSEDHSSFRIQERALSKRFKILTYDLRGHGKSSRTDKNISIDQFATDLKDLIEYLKLDNIILLGWSMGAAVVFEYIKQFGQDKLSKICIIDKGPKLINDKEWKLGLYHGQYWEDDAIVDLDTIKNHWEEFCKRFIKKMSPNFNDKELQLGLERMTKNSPEIMYSAWKSMAEKDYRNMLKDIYIPTLIIFGEKSTLYSLETGKYLEENIKGSKLIVFENCTHLLVKERPIRLNKLLIEFVENNLIT